MLGVRVILVEPKYDGNVGAVARICQNFEADELVLVNPPKFGDHAFERAVHAKPFLLDAPHVDTFEEAIDGVDYLIGTTAKVPRSDKLFLRNPVDARDVPGMLEDREGLIGVAFGREDFGLLNPELEKCDLTVTIPTSHDYRSLNLSHAVAVVLYELYVARQNGPFKTTRRMDGTMRDNLYAMWDLYIDALGLPDHKRKISRRVVRKLLGRAVPSSWEFYVVMGLLKRGLKRMGEPVPDGEGADHEFDLPENWEDELRDLLLE